MSIYDPIKNEPQIPPARKRSIYQKRIGHENKTMTLLNEVRIIREKRPLLMLQVISMMISMMISTTLRYL
jgi:hypothetical protein